MGLYVPLVNQAFWTKIGPKLQDMMLKIWAENLPTYRANAAKAQADGRAVLTKQGVTFVDVPAGGAGCHAQQDAGAAERGGGRARISRRSW